MEKMNTNIYMAESCHCKTMEKIGLKMIQIISDINSLIANRPSTMFFMVENCSIDAEYCCIKLQSLLEIKVEWLYYILEAFNSGDFVRYQELCRVHNAARSAQPALVEDEKKLLEKINILCLMEMIIFS
ncbi:hypothetical protein POM88_051426 [Heracleum sosnowskyi]|uniref:Uncharacterized protein n=1 Tax=Heracleum sosnowskyi TaxID=360622 RepID=A0AAD8M193_9APIA|nr:hypothetical protein POM88_051426 [Heracleum sosnowskyi]